MTDKPLSTRLRYQNVMVRLRRVSDERWRKLMPIACSILHAFAMSIQQRPGDVNSSTWVARRARAWMLGSLGSSKIRMSLTASQRLHRSFSFVDVSSGVVEDTMLRITL